MNKKKWNENLNKQLCNSVNEEITEDLADNLKLLREYENKIRDFRNDIVEARVTKKELEEDIKRLRVRHKYITTLLKNKQDLITANIHMECHLKFMENIEKTIKGKENELSRRKGSLTKTEKALLERKREIDAFKASLNTSVFKKYLEKSEKFDEERHYLIESIMEYGSVIAACNKDPRITIHYKEFWFQRRLLPEFDADINFAVEMFKERYVAGLVNRAEHGTLTPVINKHGEHSDDVYIRNDKLAMDVAKGIIPEIFDRKAYRDSQQDKKQTTNNQNTINIINYSNATNEEETIFDIGVVKSVDDQGMINRITHTTPETDIILEDEVLIYEDEPAEDDSVDEEETMETLPVPLSPSKNKVGRPKKPRIGN